MNMHSTLLPTSSPMALGRVACNCVFGGENVVEQARKRRPLPTERLSRTRALRPDVHLSAGSPQRRTCRGSGFAVRAGLPGSEKQDAEDQANAAEEERIERLEKLTRQKRRKPQPPQLRQRRVDAAEKPRKGRWREGQLFPEGWESMGILEKGWQLWAGDRGFLFWTAKLAFNAIFVLIGGWILFRFVGPALGLYELTNSLTDAPLD